MAKKRKSQGYSAEDFNPQQAADSYRNYLKNMKRIGAKEKMTQDQFVETEQWRKWRVPLKAKKIPKLKSKRPRTIKQAATRFKRMQRKK